MSLGVLNNLNATYAANNLNNTSNSLSKTLQQLSSGSKINSGSDDAAGLSLVNGLQANQQALTQSSTNATEGVGLLQVADGALSQVTSLLNRAVTLATEVSNGTLTTAQQSAANTEYKSILSEVSNIGSTTTYNQQTVFGSKTDIYTGDSTSSGSSINSLNIRSLSSSNLGDTSGTMSYSSASSGSGVFIDLTTGTDTANKASVTDYLNGGSTGSTSIVVSTLSSTGSTVPTTISVGGSSGYANTAQGLISAINNSNLGVTASFTTDKIAGSGTTGDTGIQISGSVGSGTSPSTASFSGTIKGGQANAGTDTLTGSVTLQVGNSSSSTITMDQVAKATGVASGAVTMSNLKDYINTNASLGVTASINASTGVMTLSSTSSTNPALKVTSNLTDTSITSGATTLTYSSTAAYSVGVSTPTAANGGVVDSTIGGAASNYTATTPAPATKAAGTVGTITTNADGNLSGKLSITDTEGNAIATNLVLGVAATGTGVNSGTDTIAHLTATLTALAALDSTANTTFNATNSTTLTIAQTADTSGTANVATTIAADTANVQTTADTPALGTTATGGGIATISYTDAAGQDLSTTDLSSQADAQKALTALNSAITDVAAQDGYIGAQINTLNSVSSVLSTQSENIQSAQNAVQATDYASASSNMSKYEILSQTGISALAQANSVQQEVTKLLQ